MEEQCATLGIVLNLPLIICSATKTSCEIIGSGAEIVQSWILFAGARGRLVSSLSSCTVLLWFPRNVGGESGSQTWPGQKNCYCLCSVCAVWLCSFNKFMQKNNWKIFSKIFLSIHT